MNKKINESELIKKTDAGINEFLKNTNTLNKFIINNNKLELLESKLNSFNPFRVLKIDKFEIRHSNFLAWVFNPKENHGFQDKILKKTLCDIIIHNEDKNLLTDSYEIYKHNFNDTKIYREYKNIDLLAVSKSNKLVLLIENKVNSKESKNQLNKYLEIVKREFSGYKLIPVFLTLNGNQSSNETYCTYDYEKIYQILKFSLEMNKDNINNKIIDFINYYLKIVEVMIMEDEDVKKLCKEIYNEHKEAIDLINQYISSSSFSPATEIFKEKHKNILEIAIKNNTFWFIPEDFCKYLPNNITDNWDSYYPVSFWFEKLQADSKLILHFEIGPLKDANIRLKLMTFLKENDFEIKERALKASSKYTRIFNETISFKKWDNKEELAKQMNKLYESDKAQEFEKKIFGLFNKFKF